MVCYRIYLLCPVHERENRNILNDKCLKLLIRQNCGYLFEMRETNGSQVIVVDICDSDASDFLWHLPYPFTVLFVVLRSSKQLLFSHRVFEWKRPCHSRLPNDKGVYWAAKAIEKHLGNVKIDIEDYLYALQPNETK